MTLSWDSLGPAGARPRRIRGGEIPTPSATSWRVQQRQARAQIAAWRTAAATPPQETPTFGFRLAGMWIDGDAIFAFGFFLPMVFLVQFATLGAAMIAGLTPIYLFCRRKELVRIMTPRLFLFAFPMVAVVSVVWSETPKDTTKFALEFVVTVIAALLISSACNQRAVLKAMVLAFLIYCADAVLTGGQVKVGAGGEHAFSGLTSSKNLMADIASTGLIVSLAVIVMAARARDAVWVAIGGVAVLVELYCVVGARSAGAVLGLVMGLTPLVVLSALVPAGRALRAWLTSMVAVTLLVIGLNFRVISQAIIDLSLSVFDKDPTLTGRTYLWYRAFDLIREKPVLGRGYFSFWLQGNIDAEGLWRYAGITERSGFNFHNTLVDLLVTVGWLGAAVLIVTVLIGAFALVRRFVNQPSLALVFWISVLLYELSRTPIETLGIQPFYFSTTLVFGALAAGFGRKPPPHKTAHRPIRTAAPVQVQLVDYASDEAWANPRLAPARGSLRLKRRQEAGG
ncbi:MAG TPA: O-antigen ligase family protein [Phenylobacterium sp.]|uniref:O-antigen ligase family protein n=1 Tax=Phenylobacterium sp. TaxID=1871053 RepID=UPI002B4658AB|nr:O-antigen ligase family protein [Phenylobacterium sp.]HKR87504.1 O-antigen ligase family protein [Phenylobacterium sp.]